jgi:lipopolysaccharide transport system ATP-binding protein
MSSSDNDVVIKVTNLCKRYEIYETPLNRLKQFIFPRLQRIFGNVVKLYFKEFWAIKNVSFEIKKGETVGIIGRNGSGKSTLLQLICGTLNPTSGSIQTNGRIGALLELGSGFNPELTGRENVYLNASVLGLSRAEIDVRFDDIVEFADIGQFIDQPVKTYSSGMYVRLAFAVIAHVDADILVVDEALSVGDAIFTQKCMRFIRNFQERGSLLFVSHDTASVQNLCQTAIWLKHGSVEKFGDAKSVSEEYFQYTLQEIYGDKSQLKPIDNKLTENLKIKKNDLSPPTPKLPKIHYEAKAEVRNNIDDAKGWKTGGAEILSVSLLPLSLNAEINFEGGERVRLTVRAQAHIYLPTPILGFLVRDRLGQDLFGENTLPITNNSPCPIKAGQVFEASFEFILPMLPNGQYAVMSSVANGDLHENVQHHWMHDALIINVSSSKVRYGLIGIAFELITLKLVNYE